MTIAEKKSLTNANVREVWKDFKGGAPIAKQSHWFVKFKLLPRQTK